MKKKEYQMYLTKKVNYRVFNSSLWFFIWVILLSCDQKVDFRLEFARELEQLVSNNYPNRLDSIRQLQILDYSIVNSMENDINTALEKIQNSELMKSYLDSLSNSSFEKNMYCVVMLSRYINEQSLDDPYILKDWQLAIDEHEKITSMIKEDELHRLISINNEKYDLGDTVSAFFIKELDFEPARLAYNKHLSDSAYYLAPDYFKILGVVKAKKYHTIVNNRIDSNSLVFSVKIFEMNESSIYFGKDELRIGDNIDIVVESYGRVLGNQSDYDKW